MSERSLGEIIRTLFEIVSGIAAAVFLYQSFQSGNPSDVRRISLLLGLVAVVVLLALVWRRLPRLLISISSAARFVRENLLLAASVLLALVVGMILGAVGFGQPRGQATPTIPTFTPYPTYAPYPTYTPTDTPVATPTPTATVAAPNVLILRDRNCPILVSPAPIRLEDDVYLYVGLQGSGFEIYVFVFNRGNREFTLTYMDENLRVTDGERHYRPLNPSPEPRSIVTTALTPGGFDSTAFEGPIDPDATSLHITLSADIPPAEYEWDIPLPKPVLSIE